MMSGSKGNRSCLFCNIIKGEIDSHVVYEDELVMAFLDIDPINEGHVLLIPKKHYLDADEMPEELLCHIMKISKKLVKAVKEVYKPDGYSIMQNGGLFNEIGHYHMHLFPRYENDGFGWVSGEDKTVDAAAAIRIGKLWMNSND